MKVFAKPRYEAAWLNDTPVGTVAIVLEDGLVRHVRLDEENPESWVQLRYPEVLLNTDPALALVKDLERYFSAEDLDVFHERKTSGNCQPTPFLQKVYNTLRNLKAGETISYGELAEAAGFPGAARAVGNAMGRNPVPLVIPCHRVITATRCLGGFTGGLHLKRALLKLEGAPLLPEY